MASVLSVVITSYFYQGVNASISSFTGICLTGEIGENILEAKSCQPSGGIMLRIDSQVAYTNSNIVERWCSGGGFVLTSVIFYFKWAHN